MKRTATLVAGLLLVTGTVFAAPTFTTTGQVEFKNTVFETDKAILQNSTGDDTMTLTVTSELKFDAKNSLTATVKEGNDDTLKLEYKNVGDKTVLTVDTISDSGEGKGLFQEVNIAALHTDGNVKAQVKGKLTNNIYLAGNGQSNFTVNDDADAVFLEYKVTPSVTTTFYPYATKFGVDSIFNDDGTTSELKGIKGSYDFTKSETITEDVAGVKVAMTEGALKGLAVKVGTMQDNADGAGKNGDATFYVDAEYSKTLAGFTGKVDFAMTTDKDELVKQNIMLDVTGKVATVDVQGQLFQATGKTSATDVTAVYAKASTKIAGVSLLGEAAAKKLGTNAAVNGVYLEGKKEFAEMNGVKPTATLSFKDVDLKEKSVPATITAKVEAGITQDKITITPALEIANATDTTAKATIAVKYSF